MQRKHAKLLKIPSQKRVTTVQQTTMEEIIKTFNQKNCDLLIQFEESAKRAKFGNRSFDQN